MVPLTEEFLEHCAEGALSIEVYGHRRSNANNATLVSTFNGNAGSEAETSATTSSDASVESGSQWTEEEQQAKARSLADR